MATIIYAVLFAVLYPWIFNFLNFLEEKGIESPKISDFWIVIYSAVFFFVLFLSNLLRNGSIGEMYKMKSRSSERLSTTS